MKKIILAFSIMVSSFSAIAESNYFNLDKAEYTVKFGGWSYHGDGLTKKMIHKYQDTKFKYNENHSGLGFEYAMPIKNSNHFLTGGAWYMKDSFNKDSFHLGLGYKYRFNLDYDYLDSIDLNLVLTYYNRGVIDSTNQLMATIGVDSNGNPLEPEYNLDKNIKIKRDNFTLPTPYITFNITERVNIDTMILLYPTKFMDSNEDNEIIYHDELESVFFIRAGFTF